MTDDYQEPDPEIFRRYLQWIDDNASQGVERYEYSEPVRSVTEAIEASGLQKGEFIKSICLKHKSDDLYVIAIILAVSKVDKRKLVDGIGPKKWRMATPEQIHNLIGYPAGGVPPVCLPSDLTVLVDPRVLSRESVIGGGGTQSALMRLPARLILASGAVEKIISIG